jgi:hypothetical protein
MDKFIGQLIASEDDSITSVVAFSTYNPSIGRVLEAGGVKKFQAIARDLVRELPSVRTPDDFDALHDKVIAKIIRTFKTSKGSRVSYGQAQKGLNVFLKVYVDWAHRPSRKLRCRLLPMLHVPLERILMKAIKQNFAAWYKAKVRPSVRVPQQAFSISRIDKRMYYRWQTFFRATYPKKPLIFDIAWALNRAA